MCVYWSDVYIVYLQTRYFIDFTVKYVAMGFIEGESSLVYIIQFRAIIMQSNILQY